MSLSISLQLCNFLDFAVVGTMWSVDNEVARQVVSVFYNKLADDSGRLDSTRAAVALHKAVKKLRVNHVLLEQQIVFIHMCVYF